MRNQPNPTKNPTTQIQNLPVKYFRPDALPLDALNTVDAKIEFNIARLGLTGDDAYRHKRLAGTGQWCPGDQTAQYRGRGQRNYRQHRCRYPQRASSVSLELKAPSLDLGELLREFADLDKLRGNGAVDISLRGTGKSVAEIMATLDGHSRLLMNKGEMKNDFLGNISGLSQTIGKVFGKKEWIVVECIASDFEVANGIANSRVNVINTELLLITTEGKVDLGQEKPDLKVSPRPKGIDLSLAVPVNIGGSLASPTVTPDTLATAKKIGGILGAIAFPPAAIIGLGELGGSDNPCLQTAKADTPLQPEKSKPSSPVESATDAAKDAIEGVGEGLKKLFGR